MVFMRGDMWGPRPTVHADGNELSEVLSVTELAREAVLLVDGEEVARIPLSLVPGEVARVPF